LNDRTLPESTGERNRTSRRVRSWGIADCRHKGSVTLFKEAGKKTKKKGRAAHSARCMRIWAVGKVYRKREGTWGSEGGRGNKNRCRKGAVFQKLGVAWKKDMEEERGRKEAKRTRGTAGNALIDKSSTRGRKLARSTRLSEQCLVNRAQRKAGELREGKGRSPSNAQAPFRCPRSAEWTN